MPILSSLSVLGAHFSAPVPAGNWYDDTSDAHHTVTLNGSVTQVDEGGGVVAANVSAGALIVADSYDFRTNNFTVEFFVKYAEPTSYYNELLLQNPNGLSVYATTGSLIGVGAAYVADWINNVSIIDDGNWHHLAVVRNEGLLSLYVDGIVKQSVTDSFDYNASSGSLVIGGNPNLTSYFNAKLAGYRITNTAIYTSDFTVPTTLPTAVSGTQLLLIFGATAVPTV